MHQAYVPPTHKLPWNNRMGKPLSDILIVKPGENNCGSIQYDEKSTSELIRGFINLPTLDLDCNED